MCDALIFEEDRILLFYDELRFKDRSLGVFKNAELLRYSFPVCQTFILIAC